MDFREIIPAAVLHWNYRGFTEFPLQYLHGEETDVTDMYLKENLISRLPSDIAKLVNLESLYLSGNDIPELPREISTLKCLKCLDVSGNRLRRIPDEIGELRRLKFLILDENELSELPLRVGELRALRYLSVCDNKLQWLPQRPVHNYHHCEFRFWRNIHLQTIPYSLWYHMFRDQQTRSLNIGCLRVPKYQHFSQSSHCRLKLSQDSIQWEFDVDFPQKYNNVIEHASVSPPSLYELTKRKLYEMIFDAVDKLTPDINTNAKYHNYNNYYGEANCIKDDGTDFNDFNINDGFDENGNNCSMLTPHSYKMDNKRKIGNMKDYYVPADIVEEYFNYLPIPMKSNLCNGPISRCENVTCKKPIFDYVLYEFSMGEIILIDNTEEVLLSAAFCSKPCADKWKNGKTNLITWKLVNEI